MEPSVDDLLRAARRPPVCAVAPAARRAAVAAVVSPGPRGLSLLFIQRAERTGDPWSGQIAFPGGRLSEGDAGPLDAAVREVREEIDLDLSSEHLLGPLDDLAPLSGLPELVVHPWLFCTPELPQLRPDPREVAGVFTAPLADLLAGRGRGQFDYPWRGGTVPLPAVTLAGPDGASVRLWGMTLRIVDDLLHRLDGRGIGLARPVPG